MNQVSPNTLRLSLDFVIILVLSTAFTLAKDLWLVGVNNAIYEYTWSYRLKGALSVGTLSALTCYLPFVVGVRVLKSPAVSFSLSWAAAVWFLYLTSNFWWLFFFESGYWHFSSNANEPSAMFYTLFNPVTGVALWASWRLYKAPSRPLGTGGVGEREKGSGDTTTLGLVRALLDFVIILFLCVALEWLKTTIFTGSSPRVGDGALFALICYPVFLVGIRTLKSPKSFCALSWATAATVILLFLWLRRHYSYTVGDREVLISGIPTPFGLFYDAILSPPFLMALWATWLAIRQCMSSPQTPTDLR